jgi:TatA/E family protein of Tat protein translocase
MFGSLGAGELLLIFAVILIVFGPRKIPEIGRMLGKAMGEFRKATDDLKSTIDREVRLEELKKITPPSLESIMMPAESVSRTEPVTSYDPDPIPAETDSAPSLALPDEPSAAFDETPAGVDEARRS